MSEPVKIGSLELENVKRVRVVEIMPTASGLTVIGGRNGQGKTSVLDAIAWALGGNKQRPDEPNRRGAASPAKLRVQLSNGIAVERKGKNGTLHVTDESGMKAGQALLDEFVGQIAIDLPKFMAGSDAEKATALLQTLGIDDELAKLDGQIKGVYSDRQLVGRDAKAKRAHANKLPHYDDAPDEPVSIAELVQEQQAILARNGERQQLKYRADELKRTVETDKAAVEMRRDDVERLKAALAQANQNLEEANSKLASDLTKAKDASKNAAEIVMESTAEIEISIANIEKINEQVRANQTQSAASEEAAVAESEYDELTGVLESLKEQRHALLDGAPLPLPGLSIDEEGKLTYLDHRWSDMSSSEQLRVATAVARAAKPECGFVLVDKLEQMDSQTLAEFGDWAKKQGLQVIGTRVATDDTCDLVIEDGRVVGADRPDPTPEPEAFDFDGNPLTDETANNAAPESAEAEKKWKL